MELLLIEEARRRYGDKALAFFGCRREGFGEGLCEQDILVYPSKDVGHILKIRGEIYEFVPVSDPNVVLLEKRRLKPFYDPYMLLHSLISKDDGAAWRDSIVKEVELGIRDLIFSLYFDYSPSFIARAGVHLARARLLLLKVLPRPTHMFHQLRRNAPSLLYKLRDLWGLDTAFMEKLDAEPLKRELPEVRYELAAKKLERLLKNYEHLQAKVLLLNLLAEIPVKEDRNPFLKIKFIPVQDSPKEWIWWLRDGFRGVLKALKP